MFGKRYEKLILRMAAVIVGAILDFWSAQYSYYVSTSHPDTPQLVVLNWIIVFWGDVLHYENMLFSYKNTPIQIYWKF